MRAYDLNLEMRVVRSTVSSPKRIAELRGLGGEKLFNSAAAKDIFKRAEKIIVKTGDAPSWRDLVHDPRLDESVRERMVKFKKPIKEFKIYKKAAQKLEDYARIRIGVKAAQMVAEMMEGESVDPDDITELLSEAAGKSRKIVKEDMLRFYGVNSDLTGKDMLNAIMENGDNKFIPTGFKTFDIQSRGIRKPSCSIFASESGGGKSKLLNQLSNNMLRDGYRTNLWTLEMDHDELDQRTLSSLTGIPMTKFLFPEKLTRKEKKLIVTTFDERQKRLKEQNNYGAVGVPTADMTIRDILAMSEPYRFDMVGIDYVSLLPEAGEDEQWKALNEIVRYGKRWADNNNCAIVFLAQLSEESKLKFAKSMKDHAHLMWTWPFKEREQETRVIPVTQQKSRGQPMYNFYLKDDTDTMTIRDLTKEELKEYLDSQDVKPKSGMSDYEKASKKFKKGF